MYVFTKKNLSMYIYPLSRIHNTSLVSAYLGLDKRECEGLEYLFIYHNFTHNSLANLLDGDFGIRMPDSSEQGEHRQYHSEQRQQLHF
jgi:hypothetical protein